MQSRIMVLKNLQGSSRETDIENRLMDMGRGGEMYGKSDMETYITICKIDRQWNLLYGSGNSTGALYPDRRW